MKENGDEGKGDQGQGQGLEEDDPGHVTDVLVHVPDPGTDIADDRMTGEWRISSYCLAKYLTITHRSASGKWWILTEP